MSLEKMVAEIPRIEARIAKGSNPFGKNPYRNNTLRARLLVLNTARIILTLPQAMRDCVKGVPERANPLNYDSHIIITITPSFDTDEQRIAFKSHFPEDIRAKLLFSTDDYDE